MTASSGPPPPAPRAVTAPVITVHGFGMDVRVDRGALVLRDGLAADRRERRLHRADRVTRRILIIGTAGGLSLATLQWCADVGIALTVLDPSASRVLAVNAPAVHDDARLRRAQALASTSPLGLDIARTLIDAKLTAQAEIARTAFGDADTVALITSYRRQLAAADTLDAIRALEANAAAAYFRAWNGLPIRFARADQKVVPPGWLTFSQRASGLDQHAPRMATNPVNALLNYGYALLETEATLACHALGLDPGLGVLHADARGRDSMALDLMEPVRPAVDAYVLHLIRFTTFTRRDFIETRDGQCRLLPSLAETLAAAMTTWARELAPHAEAVAHALVDAAASTGRKRRPLTGKPKSSPRRRSTPIQPPSPGPRCSDCGAQLGSRRAKRCAACNDALLPERGHAAAGAAAQRLADLREQGIDPTNTPEARAKRSATLSANRAALARWTASHGADPPTPHEYQTEIQPRLAGLPLSTIQAATGLSLSAASRIRSGALTPHPRHWARLAALVTTSGPASVKPGADRVRPTRSGLAGPGPGQNGCVHGPDEAPATTSEI